MLPNLNYILLLTVIICNFAWPFSEEKLQSIYNFHKNPFHNYGTFKWLLQLAALIYETSS